MNKIISKTVSSSTKGGTVFLRSRSPYVRAAGTRWAPWSRGHLPSGLSKDHCSRQATPISPESSVSETVHQQNSSAYLGGSVHFNKKAAFISALSSTGCQQPRKGGAGRKRRRRKKKMKCTSASFASRKVYRLFFFFFKS